MGGGRSDQAVAPGGHRSTGWDFAYEHRLPMGVTAGHLACDRAEGVAGLRGTDSQGQQASDGVSDGTRLYRDGLFIGRRGKGKMPPMSSKELNEFKAEHGVTEEQWNNIPEAR